MTGQARVLLIDGMSLLVRSAKAAAKMTTQLSHQGVPTGTLVTFTGTMVRHLRMDSWDHVLVAWEGERDLNWRRRLYPMYKSNRITYTDDAPVMSRGQELAMEFCDAAGLRQSWQSDMEGDDILAAAWRLFSALDPRPEITVVTEDRDLLQLVGNGTVWRAWTGETTTEAHVREMYLVEPCQLPLLRAMAGDVSDGIPGIRGVGPVTAATMIGDAVSDMALFRSLAVVYWTGPMAQVMTWWMVSELRDPVIMPRLGLGKDGHVAAWHPQEHAESMLAFLDRYGLNRLRMRMEAGELPWPPVIPDKESI